MLYTFVYQLVFIPIKLFMSCHVNTADYTPLEIKDKRAVLARRPTYSVKLRLWKVSTFYFKIAARPMPPLSAH